MCFHPLSISSFVTSTVSAGLLLIASALATVAYTVFVTIVDSELRTYGIQLSLGVNALMLIWIAFASSFFAEGFWLAASRLGQWRLALGPYMYLTVECLPLTIE